MKYSDLQRTHADFDRTTLQRYSDLYRGGRAFLSRVSEYLPRNAPVEPLEVYRQRLTAAHYLNYAGPIGGQLAAWLFTVPLTVSSDPPDVDPWWSSWREDCDGDGTDLVPFVRSRFVEGLQAGSGWWRIDWPEGEAPDRAEWQAQGLGGARLRPVSAIDVTNWRRGRDGRLEWLVTHTTDAGLGAFEDAEEQTAETWTLYRADGDVVRWQAVYTKGRAPKSDDAVPEAEPPVNRCGEIPFVELSLAPDLWLMDHLGSPALESFRKRAALSWALDRAAFAMPVLKRKDRKRAPPMGTGYYLELGVEEDLTWSAPPSTAFDVLASYAKDLKDEIYRVVTLMAAGVDNNAAAVGRSGDSKLADQRATEIVLAAYGERVREAIGRTYALVTAGRGEQIRWSVGGLDRYQITDTSALLDDAVKAVALEIPSPTAHKALLTRAALALVPDADEPTRAAIRAEIEAAQTPGFTMGEETEPTERLTVGSGLPESEPPPPPSRGARPAFPTEGARGLEPPTSARPKG